MNNHIFNCFSVSLTFSDSRMGFSDGTFVGNVQTGLENG